ncbi:baseplate J/gp47 family protein [Methylocystis heyeri]|uniref:Uncharacterized protein n=1 Tax=Methylocystis heyeri TaxID=391905 RepID=A0A6B8KJI2_9HYPH|nr:baseplate J/gp47 family protein [Methylocystis heyeri]QGM46740.1 hypothetical protein H2LOC_014135 [Methylocystis heyeri]
MSRFQTINLANLPAPTALENWTFDAIIAARFQQFLIYWQQAVVQDPSLPTYDVTSLTSNPGSMLQFTDAYREGLVRQRVNEAVLATMLAKAVGTDLDQLAANVGTARASGESDDSLRTRAQLAWENLSKGGSYGGYQYQALSAAPADLAQAAVYGHEVPGVALGEVRIVLLGAHASGAVPAAALAAVKAQFLGAAGRADRKVNDLINVVPAELLQYQIKANLLLGQGADGPSVQAAQWAAAAAYASAVQTIGGEVTLGGLMAAIGYNNQPGLVKGVELFLPFSGAIDMNNPPSIGGAPFSAPVCTAINITWSPAP